MSWRELVVLLPLTASAAIWPPAFQEYTRVGDATPFQPGADEALWREYGLVEGETATYTDGKRKFQVNAWRMKDSTGAIGAWYWQLPPQSRAAKGLAYSAVYETGSQRGALAVFGNYLVQFDGTRPVAAEIKLIVGELPEAVQGPSTVLPNYLPPKVPFWSARLITGPESLKAFAVPWTPGEIGLDVGAEAIAAAAGAGRHLAVIRYPTPHLARVKLEQLTTLNRGPVHRSGPLLAISWAGDATSRSGLEELVRSVEYKATLIESEPNPYQPVKEAANMMLSIFTLTGGLLVACVVAGIAAGGLRVFSRRGRLEDKPFQSLGLGK